MNPLSAIVFFSVLSYALALDCNANPCALSNYFVPSNGYNCVQVGASAYCTCPGSGQYEIDKPCRLCNRTNPAQNVCNNGTGKLVACLESSDYGRSYGCLCRNILTGGSDVTSDADCDTTITLTSTTTTTPKPGAVTFCVNGGVLVDGICNCPSGYAGTLCQTKIDPKLCERVVCKNGGVCAIRTPNGPTEAVCLCPYGTWGDYCELNGTLGSCSASSCLNGGACKENIVGSTKFAYCHCPGGFKGPKCETVSFTCPSEGLFPDLDMFVQGRYFKCTLKGGALVATQQSCPKGLRFNLNRKLCTY